MNCGFINIPNIYDFLQSSGGIRENTRNSWQKRRDPENCEKEISLKKIIIQRWNPFGTWCLQFGAFPDGLPSMRYYDQAETGMKEDIAHLFQNRDIPKPGDMIQFQIFLPYQHWGIYVGNGEVVHLQFSPFDTSPFRIRREKITHVFGSVKSAVWNKFDQKYPPLEPTQVVKRALHMENKVPRYNFITGNCEHFATLIRYNKAVSDQAERFNFTVNRDFEEDIRRCLAEVDCGSGECLSTFQRKIP